MLFCTQEVQKIVFILNQWKFEAFSNRQGFFSISFLKGIKNLDHNIQQEATVEVMAKLA